MKSLKNIVGSGVAQQEFMVTALLALMLTAAPAETQPPLLTAEGSRLGRDAITDMPFVALTLEAGLPDGLGVSLSVMPASFLRVQLGALTNGVGVGVRLGATLVAFPTWPVRPLVSVEGGYLFGGQATWALEYINNAALRNAVSKASVGFVNAHAGLELGSRNVALVLRGGVSWLDVELGGQSLTVGSNVVVTAANSTVRGFIPSARLGLMISFG